jgi:hypothetical protein
MSSLSGKKSRELVTFCGGDIQKFKTKYRLPLKIYIVKFLKNIW